MTLSKALILERDLWNMCYVGYFKEEASAFGGIVCSILSLYLLGFNVGIGTEQWMNRDNLTSKHSALFQVRDVSQPQCKASNTLYSIVLKQTVQ